MQTQAFLPQVSVEELVTQILIERRVTHTDQLLLKLAIITEAALDEKERALIERVFYGLRHGLLRLVE
jgi:hypothetical protein